MRTGSKRVLAILNMRYRLLALCVLSIAILGIYTASQPAEVQGISTTVVISEFRFVGTTGASDEFVELHNVSNAAVDISGWKLKGSNNAGVNSVRATVPLGTIIQPGCYYLFTNTAY